MDVKRASNRIINQISHRCTSTTLIVCAGGSGDHNRFNSLRDRKARELDRSFLAQNDIVQQGLEEYEGKDMNWRLALLDGVAMAVLEELAGPRERD